MINPILIVAGLRAIKGVADYLNSAPAPAPSPAPRSLGLRPFTYSVVAVPDHKVREYISRSDDCVTVQALLDLFEKHGHDESAASLIRLANNLQRKHPACTILCTEFEFK